MRIWGVLLVSGLAAGPQAAQALDIGVGVFGGPSFPIVQDDNGTGTQFGIRIPIHPVPLLTVEPFYARTGLGDVSGTFAGLEYTRSGHDINSFGITAALGGVGMAAGLPFYPYGSISRNTLKRDGSEDRTETGYELGLGLGLKVAPLAVNVRGGFGLIATGDTSRKFINASIGVSTRVFGLP